MSRIIKKFTSVKHSETFFYSISPLLIHACSTPLSILDCNVEAVLNKKNKDTTKLLYDAYQAVQKLKTLLNTNSKKTETFNLKESLEKSILLCKAKYSSVFFLELSSLNILIKADSSILEEAFLCICNNAAESYPDRDNNIIVVYGSIDKKKIKITIQDFGRGMNLKQKYLSFIPGYTTKSKGTGIGLSFAKDVFTKLYSGTIFCQSKIENGTQFVITLPFHKTKRIHILE